MRPYTPCPKAMNPTPLSRRCHQGFTIAEVAIVTVILGVLLTSILALISQASRYLHDIQLTARSSQVLQQKMEDIRLLTWDQLTNYPAVWSDTNSTYGAYTVTITTNAFDSYAGATTVLRVTLTTTWTNFASRQIETNRLTTLVTKNGLNQYIY